MGGNVNVNLEKAYPELYTRASQNEGNLGYMKDKVIKRFKETNDITLESDIIASSNTYYQKTYNELKKQDDLSKAHYHTKERIIELNNEEARKKSNTIMVMKGAFSSFFIGIFGYVLRNANVINDGTYIAMLLISVGTFFSFSFIFNPYTFKKISNYVKKEITEQGDKLNLAAVQWADENCDCSKK